MSKVIVVNPRLIIQGQQNLLDLKHYFSSLGYAIFHKNKACLKGKSFL